MNRTYLIQDKETTTYVTLYKGRLSAILNATKNNEDDTNVITTAEYLESITIYRLDKNHSLSNCKLIGNEKYPIYNNLNLQHFTTENKSEEYIKKHCLDCYSYNDRDEKWYVINNKKQIKYKIKKNRKGIIIYNKYNFF